MKKQIKYFLLSSVIILSLTGCQDGIDIILTESIPTIAESIPEEKIDETFINTSNAVTNEIHIGTEKTNDITTDLMPITTVTITRPSIEEEFEFYAEHDQDISFEPIEETEESVLAKKYVSEMQEAVDCIADTSWNTVIDIDEYIDDGYLKDYILFKLKIYGKSSERSKYSYEFPLLEAVEQKQAGDITYIKVKFLAQYIDGKYDKWHSTLATKWVGIRNGRIVDESIIAGEDMLGFIGVEMDIKNEFGEPIGYSFPPKINPWDNIEDVKKIYDYYKSLGYGIEMKEY